MQEEVVSVPGYLDEIGRGTNKPTFARRLLSLWRRYPLATIAALVIGAFVIMAVVAPFAAPYDPAAVDGRNRRESPSTQHFFGTDTLGRDIFSRQLYGARVSLQISVLVVAVAAGVGVPLGLIGGYRGGVVDAVIMRVTDSISAFPSLVLALTLVLVLGPNIGNIMLAIGIGAVPSYARLVRAEVLSLRRTDYVLAARATGAGDLRIIMRHIWPNTIPTLIVAASLTMGSAILAEASLSFLGVGVRPPTPTWGGMLNEAFTQISVKPSMTLYPGLAIFAVALSFNLLGDGLRDALDPRLR